jgi:carbon storage regulator
LLLERKINEKISIGDNIEIYINRINEHSVRIGIKAPKEIPILRHDAKKKVQ